MSQLYIHIWAHVLGVLSRSSSTIVLVDTWQANVPGTAFYHKQDEILSDEIRKQFFRSICLLPSTLLLTP